MIIENPPIYVPQTIGVVQGGAGSTTSARTSLANYQVVVKSSQPAGTNQADLKNAQDFLYQLK
jgi:hypothetical protein